MRCNVPSSSSAMDWNQIRSSFSLHFIVFIIIITVVKCEGDTEKKDETISSSSETADNENTDQPSDEFYGKQNTTDPFVLQMYFFEVKISFHYIPHHKDESRADQKVFALSFPRNKFHRLEVDLSPLAFYRLPRKISPTNVIKFFHCTLKLYFLHKLSGKSDEIRRRHFYGKRKTATGDTSTSKLKSLFLGKESAKTFWSTRVIMKIPSRISSKKDLK